MSRETGSSSRNLFVDEESVEEVEKKVNFERKNSLQRAGSFSNNKNDIKKQVRRSNVVDSDDHVIHDNTSNLHRNGSFMNSSIYLKKQVRRCSTSEELCDDDDDIKEDPSDMTRGRRIAQYLMKYKWYNPQGLSWEQNDFNSDGQPCLNEAWKYFEFAILPRYIYWDSICKELEDLSLLRDGTMTSLIFQKSLNNEKKMEKAKPNENLPSKLYPTNTSSNELNGFGIGYSLYFSAIKLLIVLSFFAGLLCIPSMHFYMKEYSNSRNFRILTHTAMCSNVKWVPCPNCKYEDFKNLHASFRYRNKTFSLENNHHESGARNRTEDASRALSDEKSVLHFALKNDCSQSFFFEAMIIWATLVLLSIGMWVLDYELDQQTVMFDEDEQTCQDYCIYITNPPKDAYDCEEWKKFFLNFDGARVTCCTIAVDNDLLVRSLAKRRAFLKRIEGSLPPHTPLTDKNLARLSADMEEKRSFGKRLISKFLHPFHLCYDLPALYGKVVVLTSKVLGTTQKSYPVTNVFITFETEKDQRFVLKQLSGRGEKPAKYLFRSSLRLNVQEGAEPETINWGNLNTPTPKRIKLTLTWTILFLVMLGAVNVLILFVNQQFGSLAATIIISICNIIFPKVALLMTHNEMLCTTTSFETSSYLKILIFRWSTTCFFLLFSTSFLSTASDPDIDPFSLTNAVTNMFVTECFVETFVSLSDPYGFLCRHVVGPRQKTQESMNRYFKGTPPLMSERYTTLSKVMSLCLTFFVIYPILFFYSVAVLVICYYVDLFGLFRTWRPVPKFGDSTSKTHRTFYGMFSLFTMWFFSTYWWFGFPFDNLCEYENVGNEYIGNHIIETGNNKTFNVSINVNTKSYQYCDQRYISSDNLFQFKPDSKMMQWMSEDQKKVVAIYCWTLLVMIIFTILALLYSSITSLKNFYYKVYEPCGNDQNINLSDVGGLSTYIPQVSCIQYCCPLLVCNIDDVDHNFISWRDPKRPYSYYNLVNDVEEILGHELDETQHVFSIVKSWKDDE